MQDLISADQFHFERILSVAQQESFRDAVNALAQLCFDAGVDYLYSIDVVPDDAIESFVNRLLRIDEGTYIRSSHGPLAVAVPLERGGKLRCHVVVGASIASAEDFSSPDVVSTLLEELVHIEFYGRIKRCRGYVMSTINEVNTHLIDLYAVIETLINEYLANRRRAEILRTVPLIRSPLGFTVVENLVTPGLNQSFLQCEPLLGEISKDPHANTVLYAYWIKQSFSPITYDTARKSGLNLSDHETIKYASQIPFFRDNMLPFWLQIRDLFARTYEFELADFTAVCDAAVGSLIDLLKGVGVVIDGI